jgi:hypothetical protein
LHLPSFGLLQNNHLPLGKAKFQRVDNQFEASQKLILWQKKSWANLKYICELNIEVTRITPHKPTT